jgi:hypothetical protein
LAACHPAEGGWGDDAKCFLLFLTSSRGKGRGKLGINALHMHVVNREDWALGTAMANHKQEGKGVINIYINIVIDILI